MCDVATAISAGVALYGASQNRKRGGLADIGAWIQQEQYILERPLNQERIAAERRALPRQEALAEAEHPLQLQVVDEARTAGSPGEQAEAAARAAADANAALEATGATRTRSLRAIGVDPGSPAALAAGRSAQALDAATLAKASTDARESERTRGIEQRIRVAGQARGFNPNVSTIANPGAELTQTAARLSTINAAEQQARAKQLETVGNVAGQIAGKISSSDNNPQASYVPSNTSSLYPSSTDTGLYLEQGGPVDGPSHEGGGVPIEAEGGEFVIKAETAKKYGPRLLSEVNEGTAIIIPTGKPRRLKAVA